MATILDFPRVIIITSNIISIHVVSLGIGLIKIKGGAVAISFISMHPVFFPGMLWGESPPNICEVPQKNCKL